MKDTRSRISSSITLILTVWATMLLAGCRQKELTFELEPLPVSVEYDWINAENAFPEGMTLLFFPTDGSSRPWRFDIGGREGGDIEIFPGDYSVISYNNDLPGVEFLDTDSYDRFSAAPCAVSDSLTTPTGMLYGAHLGHVSVRNPQGRRQRIILTPDSLSTVYHIRLDSVSGTERIKTATAVLNGVASSVCLQRQCNSSSSCSLAAPLSISHERRYMLETVTTGLGNPDIADPRLTLEVIVTTSHGKYSKSFDVTGQVVNSFNPRDVYIYIKGLEIPAADNPAGDGDVGISVGVDGWQVIEIIYS